MSLVRQIKPILLGIAVVAAFLVTLCFVRWIDSETTASLELRPPSLPQESSPRTALGDANSPLPIISVFHDANTGLRGEQPSSEPQLEGIHSIGTEPLADARREDLKPERFQPMDAPVVDQRRPATIIPASEHPPEFVFSPMPAFPEPQLRTTVEPTTPPAYPQEPIDLATVTSSASMLANTDIEPHLTPWVQSAEVSLDQSDTAKLALVSGSGSVPTPTSRSIETSPVSATEQFADNGPTGASRAGQMGPEDAASLPPLTLDFFNSSSPDQPLAGRANLPNAVLESKATLGATQTPVPGTQLASLNAPSNPATILTTKNSGASNEVMSPGNVKLPSQSPPATPANQQRPQALVGAEQYKLAEQPKLGEHYRDDRPITDPQAQLIEPLKSDFGPDPNYDSLAYAADEQRNVYEGKQLYAHQRPLVELGRPWYQLGQLSPGYDWFGKHNTIVPQFLVYGDHRTTVASNSANGDNRSLIASELNLDLDLKLTGTERFHAFVSPLDNGVRNTRYLLDADEFAGEFDADFDFGYFEGDLGAIFGGLVDETMPFDLPFAVGVMPLVLQNGVWMEDAFLGVATTIPARNSPRFNISNMDITFFAGYDKISSDAFVRNNGAQDDSAARMYGVATFIEAMNGYFEIDYAYFDDRRFDDQSYHNIGFAFTRRYGRFVSNSTRVIVNAGQSGCDCNTADGVLLLSENSLITGAPSTLVPYFNLFAGFDRPQSAARAIQAGGVLRNTGILFESDGMTDYPTLDPTANDTFGGAFGINLIADDFSQQLIVEMAMLGVMGNDATRRAPGEQLGLGFRYQLPLTNAIIFRADGMYGFMNDQPDVRGLRFELRQKW